MKFGSCRKDVASERQRRSPRRPRGLAAWPAACLEHLEHPVGDEEAADDVDRPERDRDDEQQLVRASPSPARPSSSRPPRTTIPWIALVPDISGVCSVFGTFEITAKPTKPASTRIARLVTRSSACRLPLRRPALAPSWTISPSRVMQAPAMISSSKSSDERCPRRRSSAPAATGCCARTAARRARPSSHGRFSGATIVTSCSTTVSPGSDSSQLPPASPARSTITEPGFMRSTASAVTSLRRRAAGHQRGRDDDVEALPIASASSLLLLARLLLVRSARARSRPRPRGRRRGRARGTSRPATRPAP